MQSFFETSCGLASESRSDDDEGHRCCRSLRRCRCGACTWTVRRSARSA
jgi:hypothetical protein